MAFVRKLCGIAEKKCARTETMLSYPDFAADSTPERDLCALLTLKKHYSRKCIKYNVCKRRGGGETVYKHDGTGNKRAFALIQCDSFIRQFTYVRIVCSRHHRIPPLTRGFKGDSREKINNLYTSL